MTAIVHNNGCSLKNTVTQNIPEDLMEKNSHNTASCSDGTTWYSFHASILF